MSHRTIAKLSRSIRLAPVRRAAVYAIGLGLWSSGGLWLLFHYFVVHHGAFGPSPDPAEPWWLTLHGAFAFAAIGMFGFLWGVHIVAGWSAGRRRRSGGLLAGALAWLMVSGYLLYYLGDEDLRAIVSVLHWSIGLASPIALIAHGLTRRHRAAVRMASPRAIGHEAHTHRTRFRLIS